MEVENSNDFYIGRVVCKALLDPVGLSALLFLLARFVLRFASLLFIFSRRKLGVGTVSRGGRGGGFTVHAISRRSGQLPGGQEL